VERDYWLWDRGALERNDMIGMSEMQIGPLSMQNQNGFVSDVFPTTTLYLRLPGHEYEYDVVPAYLQFNDIPSLNTYLLTNLIDNIIIYVEGDAEFEGTFELQDRGTRTVTIQTDPNEAENGPASISYENGLADDLSVNGGLTLEGLKIYSDDALTYDYLLDSGTLITSLTLINCIVQVNKNALINSGSCVVTMINSIGIFVNTGVDLETYLADNSALTTHVLYNSPLLVENDFDVDFRPASDTNNNYVYNCLTYNLSTSYDFDIDAPGRKHNCLENTNPMFTELEDDWGALSPQQIMGSKFKPVIESPLINAGNDDVIAAYGIETDILGNDRIFSFVGVDIGPYETESRIINILSSDIRSIKQVKIEIDRIKKTLICTNNNMVYGSLYEIFQYRQEDMEEFIREEKIAIELKTTNKEYVVRTDKVNPTIAEFEAYFDSESNTVIVTKLGEESTTMLSRLLDGDSYTLYFDEPQHKLYLFLNEVSSLGVTGTKNPVKNVKFGGNPVYNG
jgi:hypothetical protein